MPIQKLKSLQMAADVTAKALRAGYSPQQHDFSTSHNTRSLT